MRWLRVVPVLLMLAGCADEIPEDVSSEMDARRAASRPADADTAYDPARLDQLLEAAPAGGYADWIAELDAGLDSVPADVAADRGEALHSVQELYTRRFAYLQDFYGPGGAASAGPALEQAVEQAASHMQELMRLIADDQAAPDRIQESVAGTRAALRAVQQQAQAAGLPPEAPRLPVPDSIR